MSLSEAAAIVLSAALAVSFLGLVTHVLSGLASLVVLSPSRGIFPSTDADCTLGKHQGQGTGDDPDAQGPGWCSHLGRLSYGSR